jgi:hypothetical protein
VVQKEKALLLVADSNLPLRIFGVAMLGAYPIIFVGSGAVETHATHDVVIILRAMLRLRNGGGRGLTVSST